MIWYDRDKFSLMDIAVFVIVTIRKVEGIV